MVERRKHEKNVLLVSLDLRITFCINYTLSGYLKIQD